MPAPFPLIERPPGDLNDIFDRQAIEMSIAHNMFIRGINAVYLQAPKIQTHQVKPFMFFCDALLILIHHHHAVEEEVVFPAYELKMGASAMGHNVDQHHSFHEGLEDLERYIKEVQEGKAKFTTDLVLEKLESFADALVQHLHDEIPTIESSKMRGAFTVQDLKDLNAQLEKRILKQVSLIRDLPLAFTLHDKSTAPEFPPLPRPILWLAQHVLWYFHSDAWAFGPCDAYGKLKPGFGSAM